MKATINGKYVIDGKFLSEMDAERTNFVGPKEELSEKDLIAAVQDGSIRKFTDICGTKWLVYVQTDLIEWEG